MVMDTRILCHVICYEPCILAAGDPADLIGPERHPAMPSVNMGISPGTDNEVQAGGPVPTDMRTFGNRGMDAAIIAEVSSPGDPDSCKIRTEQLNEEVRDPFQFFFKGCSPEQFLFEGTDPGQVFLRQVTGSDVPAYRLVFGDRS